MHIWWAGDRVARCTRSGLRKSGVREGFWFIRVLFTCFSAKGTQCDSPGQRPGKKRNECPQPPRGEMIVHPHYALSGLPRSKLPFPGAMPQAFTFCRFAASPFGHAIRGEGIKTRSTNDPNQRNFCGIVPVVARRRRNAATTPAACR